MTLVVVVYNIIFYHMIRFYHIIQYIICVINFKTSVISYYRYLQKKFNIFKIFIQSWFKHKKITTSIHREEKSFFQKQSHFIDKKTHFHAQLSSIQPNFPNFNIPNDHTRLHDCDHWSCTSQNARQNTHTLEQNT